MCAEHGVLEVLCTKHHPSLIPVFQAKGDWCAEHSFPESLCPLCHPERGGRPAADVVADDDEGPADGTIVTLKGVGTAARAGIVTTAAIGRQAGPTVSALAQLSWDASKVALVNARAGGVVREVRVDVGAHVRRGQTIAVIDSADVGADRGRLSAAQARLQSASATVTREAALFDNGISAQKAQQLARQDEDIARADVAAAEAALVVVGAGDAGRYALTAPLGGVVVRRAVAVGQAVEVGPTLFEIVDASTMWAELDVPERELAVVHEGQTATIVIDALPTRAFVGVITYIAPAIEPQTRTAHARIAVDNADGALRAAMFGTAQIAVGVDHPVVLVPSSAVQNAKAVSLVFVKLDDNRYRAHRVKLGRRHDDLVEIASGIAVGDDVVTTGAFVLKTETLKGAIGAGCCE